MQEQSAGAVLVVDDNPLISKMLKGLLEAERYSVVVCHNGAEACDILETTPVDAIVCDVMMPQMDGYQLHDRIRANTRYSHIPFVFLSALGDDFEVRKAKELGVDDYLVKPFDPKHLVAVVRGKVQRGREMRRVSDDRYDAYRKRVIHTLSHESRTPLVAINTGAELLLEQPEKLDLKKAHALIEAIRRGGVRLERLVSDFMLLQQIEAGVGQRLCETRALRMSARKVLTVFIESRLDAETYEQCDLAVVPGDDAIVRVYEPQIHDTLHRLVDNAIKFCSGNNHIDVHLIVDREFVKFEVHDRGIGIDLSKVKEAINAFGQIDRDKFEQQGSGLGLAIASRYATFHGGRLEFRHREGGGTIAALILPRAG